MTDPANQTTFPLIDMPDDAPTSGGAGYDPVIAAGTASLAPDEWWLIAHDDLPLSGTKSKHLDAPVRMICGATNADWDDLREAGFRLARLRERANGQ